MKNICLDVSSIHNDRKLHLRSIRIQESLSEKAEIL